MNHQQRRLTNSNCSTRWNNHNSSNSNSTRDDYSDENLLSYFLLSGENNNNEVTLPCPILERGDHSATKAQQPQQSPHPDTIKSSTNKINNNTATNAYNNIEVGGNIQVHDAYRYSNNNINDNHTINKHSHCNRVSPLTPAIQFYVSSSPCTRNDSSTTATSEKEEQIFIRNQLLQPSQEKYTNGSNINNNNGAFSGEQIEQFPSLQPSSSSAPPSSSAVNNNINPTAMNTAFLSRSIVSTSSTNNNVTSAVPQGTSMSLPSSNLNDINNIAPSPNISLQQQYGHSNNATITSGLTNHASHITTGNNNNNVNHQNQLNINLAELSANPVPSVLTPLNSFLPTDPSHIHQNTNTNYNIQVPSSVLTPIMIDNNISKVINNNNHVNQINNIISSKQNIDQQHLNWLQFVNHKSIMAYNNKNTINAISNENQHKNNINTTTTTTSHQKSAPPQAISILPAISPVFPNPFPSLGGHPTTTTTTTTTGLEPAERRARRLTRNRISARESRRRKKDLLLTLGKKVNNLHNILERERNAKLQEMETKLQILTQAQIQNLPSDLNHANAINDDFCLAKWLQETGPNNSIRRTAISFQYHQLKQLILPYHQQFLLWLLFQPKESFYTIAKEHRTKEHTGTGKVSSKLVGEEITERFNNEIKKINLSSYDDQHHSRNKQNHISSNTKVSCSVHDEMQVWPLLCYDLGVSVEQEERLLQSFKRMKTKLNDEKQVSPIKNELSIVLTMIHYLMNGLSYQCHSAAKRNETALVGILTPEQSRRYLEWKGERNKNSHHLFSKEEKDLLQKKLFSSSRRSSKNNGSLIEEESDINNDNMNSNCNSTLNKLCEKLSKALKIIPNLTSSTKNEGLKENASEPNTS